MTFPLLTVTVLLPFAGALAVARSGDRAAARLIGIRTLSAAGIAGLVALALFDAAAHGAQLAEASPPVPGLPVRWQLGVDGVSVVLLPVVALLFAAVLVAAPRRDLGIGAVRAILLVAGGTLGGLLALDLWLVLGFFCIASIAGGSLVPGDRSPARRAYGVTAGLSVVALAVAVALAHGVALDTPSASIADAAREVGSGVAAAPTAGAAIALACVVAAMARMGAPPFHSWLAVSLRDGSTAATVLVVSGTSLGLCLVARLPPALTADASTGLFEPLVVVAIVGALYCAFVGLGRDDLCSAAAAVVSSQCSLMLVGLGSLGDPGASGALLQGLSTMVPATGLLLAVGAVHARTGTTDVTRLGGLVRRMPRATAAYFFFAIALVGFPGSVAFVSEDLLLHGLIATHPTVAVALLGVTALNGLTVLRGGVRAFLGPSPTDHFVEDLSPRERGTAVVIGLCVALAGLAPGPLLAARRGAAERISSAGAATAAAETTHEHHGGASPD